MPGYGSRPPRLAGSLQRAGRASDAVLGGRRAPRGAPPWVTPWNSVTRVPSDEIMGAMAQGHGGTPQRCGWRPSCGGGDQACVAGRRRVTLAAVAGLLGLVGNLAPPASALAEAAESKAAAVSFAWRLGPRAARAGCPDRARLREQVARRLGTRWEDAGSPLHIEGRLVRTSRGYRVRFEVRRAADERLLGVRELLLPTRRCNDVVEPVSVVLTLLALWEHQRAAWVEPPPPARGKPLPGGSGAAAQGRSSAAVRPSLSFGTGWHAAWGPMPGLVHGPRFEVAAGLFSGVWSPVVRLRLDWLWARRWSHDGQALGMEEIGGALLGCALQALGRWAVEGCVGARWSRVVAWGEGFSVGRTAVAGIGALEGELALHAPLLGRSLGSRLGFAAAWSPRVLDLVSVDWAGRAVRRWHRREPWALRLGISVWWRP